MMFVLHFRLFRAVYFFHEKMHFFIFYFFKVGTGEALANSILENFTKTWDSVAPPPGWEKIPTFPKKFGYRLP